MIKEIIAKSALHYHERAFATNWDVNIYRGCAHRCEYCFAQYSHKYMDTDDFFGDIFIKTNIAEQLDRELSTKRKWHKEPINLCGVTDCYQPLEKKYEIMPDILNVFLKHRNPIVITTKSTLILRDIKLIEKLCGVTEVNVGTSVTTVDEDVRKHVEPGASPAVDRLNMLSDLKAAGCATTVLLMPIIPHITDGENNLDQIFELAKENQG